MPLRDNILRAVRDLAEHRIGALVVEGQWMKLIGLFSERDSQKSPSGITLAFAAQDLASRRRQGRVASTSWIGRQDASADGKVMHRQPRG